MAWIKIAHQVSPGSKWVAVDPHKSIDSYKALYDQGLGAMAQSRSKNGGFNLLYEKNPPPHKQRLDHFKWFRSKKMEVYHRRANGGGIKGISKYAD